MTKKETQWYYLTEQQLAKLVGQGTYPGAPEAWEQALKIKKAGQTATIYYSKLNSFRVINEDVPEQLKIGLSISGRAKPFRI